MVSEIDRLKRLLEALAKFSSPAGSPSDVPLPPDLNELLMRRLPEYNKNAAAKGVKVDVDLQEGGCSSMAIAESIPRVIDSLVDNAIDFSEKGHLLYYEQDGEQTFVFWKFPIPVQESQKRMEQSCLAYFLQQRLTDMDFLFPLGKKPFSISEAIFYTNQMKMAGQFSR